MLDSLLCLQLRIDFGCGGRWNRNGSVSRLRSRTAWEKKPSYLPLRPDHAASLLLCLDCEVPDSMGSFDEWNRTDEMTAIASGDRTSTGDEAQARSGRSESASHGAPRHP